MQKISAPLDEEGYTQNVNRLEAISTTMFGSLTDEVVLEFLAERRSLMKENGLYESIRDEEAKRAAALTAEEQALEEELEKLNTSITPDKDDDTLLTLIQRRKELEAKLKALNEEESKLSGKISHVESHSEEEQETSSMLSQDAHAGEEVSAIEEQSSATEKEQAPVEAAVAEERKTVLSEEVPGVIPQEQPVVISETPETPVPVEKPKKVLDALIGSEGIRGVSSQEATSYLQFLQSSPEEALAQLETLPEHLRKDKAFMLEVAKVDPAYAMHYADSKTLKKDEDFNIRIAGMKNPRDSGNPLAEMLSDMRTNQVVMAAVKQDFRNLRYATRSMEGYAEMIEIAKREAREKVKSLGQAVDIRVFLPKTLREDRVFLQEVEEIVEKLKEKSS
ncbi:MAG: hypothetical protein QG606_438 [Patescibacteria group bacterium]|nr:hypothetical protein [Patescibacteria group bacterium]